MADGTGRTHARLPTGIPGLDEVLRGGFFQGGVYIVIGVPGVGKTILGNQLAFAHARGGGRVVYATLLSETHGRLLAFLETMSFFDAGRVGNEISYLNGYGALEAGGLAGLLQLMRDVVRERRASLLVIDGMLPANTLAETEVEYKKFVQQLQTWIEVVGCTVVILSSAREAELRPEYTMVDGILELEYARVGFRRLRELTVRKLRGSPFQEGAHTYAITGEGLRVFPRIEGGVGTRPRGEDGTRLGFGRPALDQLIGGGLARCSCTLILGANGSGKTTLGMHFLAAGLDAGEPVVHVSFYEDTRAVLDNADGLGLRFAERQGPGKLEVRWIPSAEVSLDRVGYEVIETVRRTGTRRLVLDGLEAFQRCSYPDRLPAFFSALVQELRSFGVTTVLTSEASRLLVSDFTTPFPGLSAIVDNLFLLLQTERNGTLQRSLVIPKTRGRAHFDGAAPFTIGPGGIEFEALDDSPPGPARGARRGR